MGTKLCRNRVAAELEQHEMLWVSFSHAHALNLEPLVSALRAKLATSEPAWRPTLFTDVALVHVHAIRTRPQSPRDDEKHEHQLIITLTDGHGAPCKQDLAEVEQIVRTSFPFLDKLRLSAGQEFRYPLYYRSQGDTIWTTLSRTNERAR